MKMVFVPPYIYGHRVYVEKGEKEISLDKVRALFGPGSGTQPALDQRWMKGNDGPNPKLRSYKMTSNTYGVYYGFRNADDSMLFYLSFSGAR